MGDEGHGGEPMVEAVPGADGLKSELAGIALDPEPGSFTAGRTATWRFKVTDCDGKALRDFEPENGKLLHLIVVRSDLTAYQHLHPQLGTDGVWSVDIETPRAGDYRAIADFVIDGRKYVVGTTLKAPGQLLTDRCPQRRCTRAPMATTSSFSRPPRLMPAKRRS